MWIDDAPQDRAAARWDDRPVAAWGEGSPGQWDDRYEEYLIALGNLCVSAELARLRVEVTTTGGGTISGLVGPAHVLTGGDHADLTASPGTLEIDQVRVSLDEIAQLTIHPPLPG
jgi:hypothetical protein